MHDKSHEWSTGRWTSRPASPMLPAREGRGQQWGAGGMAPRRGNRQVDGATIDKVRVERNDAPLIVRLIEPAGGPMWRDVQLRVDYVTGTVEAKARRVASCLFATSDGARLVPADRDLLEKHLCDWLAANASALLAGGTIPRGPLDDASEFLFAYQQLAPLQTVRAAPGPRPRPGAATAPAAAPAPAEPAPAEATEVDPITQPRGLKRQGEAAAAAAKSETPSEEVPDIAVPRGLKKGKR